MRVDVFKEKPTDCWIENQQLKRIRQALSHIESSLDKPIKVDKLAAKVHWSRWQFQRVFNKETGTSVAQYIRNLRLSQAAKLLITTQTRQLDIALQCGFDSEISFNRSFRRTYHCTPGDYRKRGQYLGLSQPLALSRPDKKNKSLQPKLLQIKIETLPSIKRYGLRTHFNGLFSKQPNFEEVVPPIWLKLAEMSKNFQINSSLGVIDLTQTDSSHTNIPYWACVDTNDKLLQSQLTAIDLPEQEYAILPHTGHVKDMVNTLEWFIVEWLPQSHYKGLNGFDLESYSHNFSPDNSNAYMEYWIPVEPL